MYQGQDLQQVAAPTSLHLSAQQRNLRLFSLALVAVVSLSFRLGIYCDRVRFACLVICCLVCYIILFMSPFSISVIVVPATESDAGLLDEGARSLVGVCGSVISALSDLAMIFDVSSSSITTCSEVGPQVWKRSLSRRRESRAMAGSRKMLVPSYPHRARRSGSLVEALLSQYLVNHDFSSADKSFLEAGSSEPVADVTFVEGFDSAKLFHIKARLAKWLPRGCRHYDRSLVCFFGLTSFWVVSCYWKFWRLTPQMARQLKWQMLCSKRQDLALC